MLFLAARASLLTALVLALPSCTGARVEVTTAKPHPTEPAMQPDSTLPGAGNTTPALPQIDKEAPKQFQTATFALG